MVGAGIAAAVAGCGIDSDHQPLLPPGEEADHRAPARDDPHGARAGNPAGNATLGPLGSQSLAEVSCAHEGAPGGFDYCSPACPCEHGGGDCDDDSDCATGLICVKGGIGAQFGYDPDVDICLATCHRSPVGSSPYCTEECPCDAGEGDCDDNAECAPGLTCVKDVGTRYGWDEEVDVCEDTCHPSANGGWDYCSAGCACDAGEGDCDSNAECAPGLVCAKDAGGRYGWDPEIDVCECAPDSETCAPGCPCDGEPAGTSLFLQVFDTAGVPVPSAAVTVDGVLHATDGVGRIVLENLAPGRVNARIEARGHASASVVVDLPSGAHAGKDVHLLPLGAPIPFDAGAGAVLAPAQTDVRVTIPASGLVDFNGEPVTGTVEATVVLLDPTTASPADFPGPLAGQSAGTGAVVELESFGMVEVSLWQNGFPLRLAPGATATIELPVPGALASQFQPGDTVPAWWLDLDAGVWREEGAGVIRAAAGDPSRLVWIVDVEHFTWWNCDRPWTDKNCFDVTVVDTFGNPVSDILVGAQGVSYTGQSSQSYTDAGGQACTDIKLGGTADLLLGSLFSPLAPAELLVGSGPAGDCAGTGAACIPITVTLPFGTKICNPGAVEPCSYGGPPGTEDVGLCQAGASMCNATGTALSGCQGEVLPLTETCTTPFDDDCDGEANEGDGDQCDCDPGETTSCYSGPEDTVGVGICQAGERLCMIGLGKYGPCEGEVLPQPEQCETPADESCDGNPACNCVDAPSDMSAWWPGDTAAQDLVGGNDGVLQGSAAAGASGKVEGAFFLDGSGDYVEVADADALDVGTGDFSLEMWVRTADSSGVKVLVDKRLESGTVRGYTIYLAGGRLSFQLADGGFSNYGSSALVADGQWHHIAVTVDRDDPVGLRFYTDGALVTSANPTRHSGSLDNTFPFRIGSRSSSVTGLFLGSLDEVSLYKRVLTAAEIQAIHQADIDGKCK